MFGIFAYLMFSNLPFSDVAIGLVCRTTAICFVCVQSLTSISSICQVMFTYLHHSDPTIPHYRKGQWSFLRGAAATVDRPLLGWMGRFFLHNISHDHVAHRMSFSRATHHPSNYYSDFFISAPFCTHLITIALSYLFWILI